MKTQKIAKWKISLRLKKILYTESPKNIRKFNLSEGRRPQQKSLTENLNEKDSQNLITEDITPSQESVIHEITQEYRTKQTPLSNNLKLTESVSLKPSRRQTQLYQKYSKFQTKGARNTIQYLHPTTIRVKMMKELERKLNKCMNPRHLSRKSDSSALRKYRERSKEPYTSHKPHHRSKSGGSRSRTSSEERRKHRRDSRTESKRSLSREHKR